MSSDCCGGYNVDNAYLALLANAATPVPFGVGSKVLNISALGAYGYSTSLRVQSRFTILANQAFATATLVDLSWTAEDTDPLNLLTPSSVTFTVPAGGAGMYEIMMRGTWSGAANTRNSTVLTVTAAAAHVTGTYPQSAVGESAISGRWGPFPLATADTFKISGIQSSGGTLQLNPATCLVTWSGT